MEKRVREREGRRVHRPLASINLLTPAGAKLNVDEGGGKKKVRKGGEGKKKKETGARGIVTAISSSPFPSFRAVKGKEKT